MVIGKPNAATLTTLEPSKVWLIRRETMKKLLAEWLDLAGRVIEDLAGRVLHRITLVEDLSLRLEKARLVRLLSENSMFPDQSPIFDKSLSRNVHSRLQCTV